MIGTATLTGHPADIVDALVSRCGGEVLAAAGDAAGGEYDPITDGHVSRTDMRRLVAAGLVSPHGVRADVLADIAGWQGDAGSFVEWYIGEALRGLDERRDRRNGTAWHELEPEPDHGEGEAATPATSVTGTVRAEMTNACLDYLSRLVYGPKRDYASLYALAVCGMGDTPADPGTEWAHKARRKVDHYVRVQP